MEHVVPFDKTRDVLETLSGLMREKDLYRLSEYCGRIVVAQSDLGTMTRGSIYRSSSKPPCIASILLVLGCLLPLVA